MLDFATLVIPTNGELDHVLNTLSDEPKKASEILMGIEKARQPYVLRGLGWLAKIGIIDFS
jgi:hypothetical protein